MVVMTTIAKIMAPTPATSAIVGATFVVADSVASLMQVAARTR